MTKKTEPRKTPVKRKTVKKKEQELPEEQEFLAVLKTSFYKVGGRTKMDRYREFRQVFLGSDEGKRVLYEILALAKLSAPITEPYPAPVDEKRMLIREGERQLAASIISIINKEPNMDRPSQVNRSARDAT